MVLDATSQRVLGSLMEKEMTTPDAYPLSLNAIVAAANQRSSRDPVMDLTEDQVRMALHALDTEGVVVAARDGGRVARYEHRIRTVLNLRRDETAVMCLLLLRGAQTPGELRTRAERMYSFEDLASVQATLDRLAGRERPLVAVLPRAPGSREVRTMHLLGGPAQSRDDGRERAPGTERPVSEVASNAIETLQDAVAKLERRVDMLEARFREQPEA